MSVKVFYSRYFQYVIDDYNKKHQNIILCDPHYLDNAGRYKYMINESSEKKAKEAEQKISKLIGDFLKTQNPTKNPRAPPPLENLIL